MDWEKELYNEGEKPLDNLVTGYSHTSIFRKIAFIGDSLSAGEFETRDSEGKPVYCDMHEYSWGSYIARKNGLQAYIFAKGGMTAKKYMDGYAEEKGFFDREKACQAYVIAMGVNDLSGRDGINLEIGSLADIDDENPLNNKPTFIGNYARIIQKYKEISPHAKFFVLDFPSAGADDKKATAVAEAMYSLAEHFDNLYVIDLYKYGPVYDSKFRDKYYLYGHLTPSGYILTAKLVDSYIDYIVRHNPDDFRKVGFIGTDIEI